MVATMYRPGAFAVDDLAVLHTVIRERVFTTLAAIVGGTVTFAYAPVVLDTRNGSHGRIRYHLAIGNALAKLEDGARVSD